MISLLIYFGCVWLPPLTLLGYSLYRQKKRWIILSLLLIPLFIFFMPLLAFFLFGSTM